MISFSHFLIHHATGGHMGIYNIKQLIIIRKDLGMNKGKLAAQAAHASVAALFSIAQRNEESLVIDYMNHKIAGEWIKGSFAKIALAVRSEEELKQCFDVAKEYGFPCAYIVDSGVTVFNGQPTPTCIGIGPARAEELDALFSSLPLY